MALPDSDVLDSRRRRLLFRATHRGTHENDLMIGGFVRTNLAALCAEDFDALEALLDLPDTDLADWLTGRRPIPDDVPSMLHRIRAHVLGAAVRPREPAP
jgi:antitoxin CptB